ncbi:energy-coupled thiamine transporter ThiT [Aerococcus kribbianus]|uniref:Energy-coupled thiamine transporter ThiT n=1 Tax=Aerococcus kribbianus TaxID=2999064 RepID=A0A9X3FUL6_9LACT|nr:MULTISPECIES: energy-coupled thiamine transporter ThiT [unclassified Aerococcus]MCZ0717206.1 energy-coupled thiamine transporter ThiT [Aerococcus sp. YH-aer221]MCZ0725494.1 energy-coupled thiamine transporter ThiT [Aerococcus sp. YH-aer222]
MKSAQRFSTIVEGLLLVSLALLIESVFPDDITARAIPLRVGLSLLLLYAFRRGPLAGFAAGFIFGGLNAWLIMPESYGSWPIILAMGGIGLALGVASLFARNLQRTLHNKRMKSVYLNLVTGTVLSLLLYFAGELVINRWLFDLNALPLSTQLRVTAVGFAFNLVLSLVILILLLNIQSKYFIPKNTPYISRKERSRLLND